MTTHAQAMSYVVASEGRRLIPDQDRMTNPDCATYLALCQAWLDVLFIQRLGLHEVTIPQDLALAHGLLRGTPVSLRTRRFVGPGFSPLSIARIQTEQGQVCSLTVVGLPPTGGGLPILGMDLIALSGALSLVAVDLAPTDARTWQADCEPVLLRLSQQTESCLVPRKRPQFTVDTFSPRAVIAGARSGSEWSVFCALVEFLQQASDLWLRSVLREPLCGQAAHAAEACVLRWLAAEQQNRKEHNALAGIFGAAFAERYLNQFLFSTNRAGEQSGTTHATNRNECGFTSGGGP